MLCKTDRVWSLIISIQIPPRRNIRFSNHRCTPRQRFQCGNFEGITLFAAIMPVYFIWWEIFLFFTIRSATRIRRFPLFERESRCFAATIHFRAPLSTLDLPYGIVTVFMFRQSLLSTVHKALRFFVFLIFFFDYTLYHIVFRLSSMMLTTYWFHNFLSRHVEDFEEIIDI